MAPGCRRLPYFGMPGEKPTVCMVHRTPEMIAAAKGSAGKAPPTDPQAQQPQNHSMLLPIQMPPSTLGPEPHMLMQDDDTTAHHVDPTTGAATNLLMPAMAPPADLLQHQMPVQTDAPPVAVTATVEM